nr:hypothetical protein [Tanacetum cinerariifolium]
MEEWTRWETGSDGNDEGLMEIGKLSMLTFLDLFVPHIHLIPKANQENIVPTMYCESLDDLTRIMLSQCDNLSRLVEYSSDWDADVELGGENTKKQFFSKLEHLVLLGLSKLDDCNKLVRLFSVNAARGLVNLQTLTIFKCSSLKDVIWDGDEGDINMVVFRRLVKIELRKLKNLKSFYAGKVKMSYPSSEKVEIYGCNRMEKWDNNGTYDTPNLKLVNQAHADFTGFLAGMYFRL